MSNENSTNTHEDSSTPINPATLVKTPDLSVKLEHSLDKSINNPPTENDKA